MLNREDSCVTASVFVARVLSRILVPSHSAAFVCGMDRRRIHYDVMFVLYPSIYRHTVKINLKPAAATLIKTASTMTTSTRATNNTASAAAAVSSDAPMTEQGDVQISESDKPDLMAAAAAVSIPSQPSPTTLSSSPAAAAVAASLPPNRFELELEFLQSLASPAYLHYLATAPEKYLQDPQFMAYLRYLRYWKQPEYARLISYPHALYMLDLLLLHDHDTVSSDIEGECEEARAATTTTTSNGNSQEHQGLTDQNSKTTATTANPINMNLVARELVNVSFRNFIHQQQYFSWQYRALHLYGGGAGGGADNTAATNLTTTEYQEPATADATHLE